MDRFRPSSPAFSAAHDSYIKREAHDPLQISQFRESAIGQDTSQSRSRYSTPPNLGIYPHNTSMINSEYPDPSDKVNMLQTKLHPYATPMASPPLQTAISAKNVISRPNLRPQRQSPPKSSVVLSGAVEKASSSKKKSPSKSRAARPPGRMQAPLSQMAPKFPNVEIIDIDTFVHRPYADRHLELQTSKSPGKIKRPMNAFMLYRKAYQNLAKIICTHNNHQVVSQACGDSWAIETMAVREQFNLWAKIERVNHQSAHPGYKFSPSKNAPVLPQPITTEYDEADADGEIDMDMSNSASLEDSPSKQRQARLQNIRIQSIIPPSRDHTPVHNVRDETDQHQMVPLSPEPSFETQTYFFQAHYPVANSDYTAAASQSQQQYFQNPMSGLDMDFDSINVPNSMISCALDMQLSVEGTGSSQMQEAMSFSQAVVDPQMVCPDDLGALQPHSYFDEWVYPFGPDSMTVVDSMMNLDPQMSYLSSTWELDA